MFRMLTKLCIQYVVLLISIHVYVFKKISATQKTFIRKNCCWKRINNELDFECYFFLWQAFISIELSMSTLKQIIILIYATQYRQMLRLLSIVETLLNELKKIIYIEWLI